MPQYLHSALKSVDAVVIGSCVELKLILSQVWQEIWSLNLYTQIILRNKTVILYTLSSKSTTINIFGYIYNLLMKERLEMHTEFSQKF